MREDKTIAEISDNIREAVKMLGDDVPYVASAGQMRDLANQLDKAAIRERAEAATKAATDAINLTEEKWRRQCADTAKLREALTKILNLTNSLDEDCAVDPVEIRDLARAALAAPARNCDVGTAEEQTDRFKDLCRKYRRGPGPRANCKGCPIEHESLHVGCTFAWSLMPYEEGGVK